MKKTLSLTLLGAVILIAAVVYAVWSGLFAPDESEEGPDNGAPQRLDNVVASQSLPGYLETAGLLTYEHFNEVEQGKVPDRYVFQGEGEAAVESVPTKTNLSLKLFADHEQNPFTLVQSFPEQSDLLTLELKAMQPEAGEADLLTLTSQDEPVLTLQLNDGELRSTEGSVPLHTGYEPGNWLTVKVVADVKASEALVYVNGLPTPKKVAFTETVEQIDGWSASVTQSTLYIDDIIAGPGKLDFPIGFATVGMLPIGGMGGEEVTVTTAEELSAAIRSEDPLMIYVEGELELDAMYKVNSNKTIIGVDDQATILYGGLRMQDVSNVIIRNLHFKYADDDGIEIRDGSTNIWIDHNYFQYPFDGALDIRLASDFITVSWNHFYDVGKTSLVSSSDDDVGDEGHLHVTYHHNRFEETTSRNPMVRFGEGHILNNLYQKVSKYGARAYTKGSLFIEGNAYYDTKTPMEIVNGQLEERNNLFENSGDPVTEGTVFDPMSYYTYPVQQPELILETVEAGAGAGNVDAP